MKVLKLALCLIFIAVIAVPIPNLTARADDGRLYAIATSTRVYICEEPDENSDLFAVPYTYYVEILRELDDWYHVRYAANDGLYEPVQGYCKKDGLMIVGSPPENAYLYYPIEITLTSAPREQWLPSVEVTVTAAFYGNYVKGASTYKCVRYDGKFGYIEGELTDYPTNVIPSTPAFSQGGGTQSKDDGNAKLITVVIICALAAGAVIILIVTGRRKKPKI